MFYYSIKSKEKVVHFKGCHHLKNISKNNLKTFKSINDVRKSEYRICSCCSPIIASLKKEQSELRKFCLENGLLYFMHKGNLHIRTCYSKWKVLASNTKNILELHHQNSFKKEHDDSVPGYHKQNFISDSVLGYLQYINEHEHYRLFNPVQIITPKEPPRKGTKRYRAQQRTMAKKERKRQIWNVLNLINSLSVGTCVAQA